MKGLGEVVDDLELRIARLGKLLHVAAAIGVGRAAPVRSAASKRHRQRVSRPFPTLNNRQSAEVRTAAQLAAHKPQEKGKSAADGRSPIRSAGGLRP